MNDTDHPLDDLLSAASTADERQRLTELWSDLGHLPEVAIPQGMSDRFAWRLHSLPHASRRRGAPWVAIAASFIVGLLAGATLSVMIGAPKPQPRDSGLQSSAIAAAIPHPSAAQRLAAVDALGNLMRTDAEARSVLVERAFNDPTPAVQLAAIDHLALLELSSSETDSVARALPRLGSPIVQVALLDLLTARGGPAVTAAVEELSRADRADDLVRRHAGLALSRIPERTTT